MEERRPAPLRADVHYYLSSPSTNPAHDGFAKGSQVVFYPATPNTKGALEILMSPGTREQDTISGYLNSTHLHWSHEHPTLVTLALELAEDVNANKSSSLRNNKPWHVVALDQRNESRQLFRIHAIDIYLWTEKDASTLVESIKRILPPSQVQLTESTSSQPEHSSTMSPVVRKLEHAAISDPAYGHKEGSTIPPLSFPPPPPSQPQEGTGNQSTKGSEQSADYAPLAYNPAAPAAPEPIRHREKTPPPPDAESGTGLNAAFAADQGQTYAPPPLQKTASYPLPPPPPSGQQHFFGGPPQRQPSFGPAAATSSPPPPTGSPYNQHQPPAGSPFGPPQRTATFPLPPPPPPQSIGSTGPPPGQQYAHSFSPPPQDPNARTQSQPNPALQSPSLHSPPPQGYASPYGQPPQQNYSQQQNPPSQTHQQQQQYSTYPQEQSQSTQSPPIQSPPTGGYSNYQHGQPQQQQSQSEIYNVHNQVYRPTEGEAGAKASKHSAPAAAGPGQQPGKLEARADKVGKVANRWMKKLEKKI
ncbi:MAG: hypothetical protein M1836_000829 [Candelina mexicana]|nr:MAG: hypothetical protein M1836_000829 [Candelina mexicana]